MPQRLIQKRINIGAIVFSVGLYLIGTTMFISCSTGVNSQRPTSDSTSSVPSSVSPTSPVSSPIRLTLIHLLQTSASIYETTMIAAGEAHGNGTISDSQLSQIKQAGEEVHSALTLAKSTLSLYLSTGDPQAAQDLSVRILEYDRLLLKLRDLAKQGGVK